MKEVWNTIEAWLSEHAPHLLESLEEGITEDAVSKLEQIVGAKLPADFVDFYRIHNGQSPDSEGLIDAEELLSFDRIGEEWSIWKDLLDEGNFEEDGVPTKSDPQEGIRPDWWNSRWIPFTYDGSGNHYCLDLDPAEKGAYGQVIRMWHDDAERTLEADSFASWIHQYAQKLKTGEYIYSEEWGGILKKEEAD